MKTRLLALAIAASATLFTQSQASACPGASIALNDDTSITAEGIIGGTNKFLVKDLRDMVFQSERPIFFLGDKNGQNTHRLIYLGSVSDKGGVVQSSYLVKNLSSGEEKVYVLFSNYIGNGVAAKGLEAPQSNAKPVRGFDTLLTAGCR